jgi:hypothetical protein
VIPDLTAIMPAPPSMPEPPVQVFAGPEPPRPVPVPAPAPPEEDHPPDKTHAFMGSSAQPNDKEDDIPFTNTAGQPEWASPYEMVPMDPMMDGSNQPAPASQTDSSALVSPQGHTVQPPIDAPVTPLGSPVDSARSAVESALSSAPFDPGMHPVESLGAQPLPGTEEPTPAAAPPVPQAASDTPVLNLPINGAIPTPPAPPALQPFVQEIQDDKPAPPPGPPPLITNGAVIPNQPNQQ